MFLLRFSILVQILFCSSIFAQTTFLDDECISSDFKATVSHKGAPFGLFDTILVITKKECVLSIEHKKMKMMKKRWLIDVCREPVHIKYGTGAVDVLKKDRVCGKGEDEFCDALEDLMQVVQDDGLIFASGEKEVLSTDHGMIYCSYLLLKGYLQREIIFSRYQKYQNILRVVKPKPSSVSPSETSIGPKVKSGTF